MNCPYQNKFAENGNIFHNLKVTPFLKNKEIRKNCFFLFNNTVIIFSKLR